MEIEGRGETLETEGQAVEYAEETESAAERIDLEAWDDWQELTQNFVMPVKKIYHYCFTPEEDGTYTLSSRGGTKELQLYGRLYDSAGIYLQGNDNGRDNIEEEPDSFDFSLLCQLNAGETYYLVIDVIDVNGEEVTDPETKANAGFEVKVTMPSQDEASITESQAVSETEEETGTETETQAVSGTETESETETQITLAFGDGAGTGAETETETETGTETKTETESETESEAETETQAASTAETAAGTGKAGENDPAEREKILELGEETETELETEAKTELETEAGTGTETGLETEAETETETETGVYVSDSGIVRTDLPKMGVSFAVGIIAALIVTRLLGGKKKRQEEVKPIPAPVREPEPSRPSVTQIGKETVAAVEGSRVGKAHGIGKRQDQQDSFYVEELKGVKGARPGDMLAVVADGMGGLKNGALVSSTVVRVCADTFYRNIETMAPADVLLTMARNVNEEVNRILLGEERSGSTMVIGAIWQGILYFLTVGDSRIWLWRSGGLIQLNREHIYQEELALKAVNCQDGLQSVNLDHQRKALTSFVGQGIIKHMDRNTEGIALRDGDKVLLTSDGVFGTIDNASLERILYQSAESAGDAIRDAIETKNKAHQDNYTAVVWEYHR